AVRKAEDQNVLDRLFSQVVVDAVDLLLAHGLQELPVERLGGLQVAAEWFFDDHPPPASIFFLEQAHGGQLLGNYREEFRRGGQVKEIVAVGLQLAIQLGQQRGQLAVGLRI